MLKVRLILINYVLYNLKFTVAKNVLLIFSFKIVVKYKEDSSEYKCVKCLCHARSGCWSRLNCAQYSIHKVYWIQANSPVVDGDSFDDSLAYKHCMQDENCVIETIINYTSQYGEFVSKYQNHFLYYYF